MAGYTQGYSQTILDWAHPTSANGDYIAYSSDGSAETGVLARTAIGATGWAAATAAQPSVKSNGTALVSAPATGSATITHFAVYSAVSAGTQKTDWQALSAPKSVTPDDQLTWAIGDLDITLD